LKSPYIMETYHLGGEGTLTSVSCGTMKMMKKRTTLTFEQQGIPEATKGK
jgi:hypothetical protein